MGVQGGDGKELFLLQSGLNADKENSREDLAPGFA
jgi:hypothetical protein